MALVAVMLFLTCSIVVAHSAIGDRHMSEGIATCMAVVTIAATAMLALTPSNPRRGWFAVSSLTPALPSAVVCARAPVPRSRAGPAVLQVFLR